MMRGGVPDVEFRNARVDPDWAQTERRTFSIAGRAISALMQTQGLGDLNRMFITTRRDQIDYNLVYIPADFDVEPTEAFDPAYMQ